MVKHNRLFELISGLYYNNFIDIKFSIQGHKR